MEPNWAADHLQAIRTLMERTALYRRALAPIMIFAGAVGLVAAVVGWRLFIYQPRWFVIYWFAVSVIALTGVFLMVRRQAWQQSEPFWSPPTRRVAQALIPPLAAGGLLGLLMIAADNFLGGSGSTSTGSTPNRIVLLCLPLAWVILYGCAIHASGFFTTRGMRLFGWLLILGGCAGFMAGTPVSGKDLVAVGHGIMGFFFGFLHLAYGVYLYFTEQRRNET